MQDDGKRGKMLTVRDGHVICPRCNGITTQVVAPNSNGENIPVYCRRCKNRLIVNIEAGQCFYSPRP